MVNPLAIPAIVMAGISFYVGLYHFLIYLQARQHREHLTFALTCLAMGLYDACCAGLYNVDSAAAGVHWQRWQVATLALVSISLPWFILDYLAGTGNISARIKQWVAGFSIYFSLAAITGLLDRSGLYRPLDQPAVKEIQLFWGGEIVYYEMTPGPLTNLQTVMGLVVFVYMLGVVWRVYRHGHRRETRPLLLSMGLFFVAVINDSAVASDLYPFFYLIEYAYLGILLLMTYTLSSEVVKTATMKEALRESEERFRALVETTSDWIWEMDLHGRYTYASPKVTELLGYTPEEVVGRTPFDLMPPEEAGQEPAFSPEVLASGRPFVRLENVGRHKDGRLVVLETSGVPIFDVAGEPLGYRGVDRDISGRKQAEESRRRMLEEMARSQRMLLALGQAAQAVQRARLPDEVFRTVGNEIARLGYHAVVLTGSETHLTLAYLTLDSDLLRAAEKMTGLSVQGFGFDLPPGGLHHRVMSEGQAVFFPQVIVPLSEGIPKLTQPLAGRIASLLSLEQAIYAPLIMGRTVLGLLVITGRGLTEADVPAVTAFANQATIALENAQLYERLQQQLAERRRAEEALRFTQFAVDRSSEAAFWMGPGARFIYVNDAACRNLGYSREELLQMKMHDIAPDFPAQVWPQHWREVKERGSFTVESHHRTREGRVFPVEITMNYIEFEGQEYNCAFVRDISERRRAEAALRQHAEELGVLKRFSHQVSASLSLDQVIEASLQGVVDCVASDLIMIYLKRADILELKGIHTDHPQYRHVGPEAKQVGECLCGLAASHREVVYSANIQDDPRCTLDECKQAGLHSFAALPLLQGDEVLGVLGLASTELGTFEPRAEFLEALVNEISAGLQNALLHQQVQNHAVELEERVLERTAELLAVNKELEAFAYSVSHDLRAPLRSIDGFSQALLEDYDLELGAEGRDYLQRVRTTSQRMGRLIDDMLSLSRVTRKEMHRELVDLSALAQEIVAELWEQSPERRVEFVVAEGLVARGDPQLLRVMLENLLGNAWKFTSKQDRARIEFGRALVEGEAVFFVRDNGVGFDMGYVDRLFGAFQRLHALSEFEGNGIGLATVQRIIHRHGGRVWAQGAVQQGATFYFALQE